MNGLPCGIPWGRFQKWILVQNWPYRNTRTVLTIFRQFTHESKRMTTNTEEELTGADAEHGYKFACDGFADLKEVAKHLAVSVQTARRYAKQDRFRWGKHPGDAGKIVVCRRSLNLYAKSIQN